MIDIPPSDAITYSLVSGLLEIGYKRPEMYHRITEILWSYAESIIQFMKQQDGKYRRDKQRCLLHVAGPLIASFFSQK